MKSEKSLWREGKSVQSVFGKGKIAKLVSASKTLGK